MLPAASNYEKHGLASERALFRYGHLSGSSHRMRCYHRLQTTVNIAVPVRHKHCTHGGVGIIGGVQSEVRRRCWCARTCHGVRWWRSMCLDDPVCTAPVGGPSWILPSITIFSLPRSFSFLSSSLFIVQLDSFGKTIS